MTTITSATPRQRKDRTGVTTDFQTYVLEVKAAPDQQEEWLRAHGATLLERTATGFRALVQMAVVVPLWRYVTRVTGKAGHWTITTDSSSRVSPASWQALFAMFGMTATTASPGGAGTVITLTTTEHPVVVILNERARLWEAEKPRALPPDERKQVLDAVAKTTREMVRASPPAIAALVVQQVVDYVAGWLDHPRFLLARAALPLFIQDLTNNLARAQIAPGTHVGMIASDAMSAPIMQAVLNTFHTAGSAGGAVRGLALIKQFLNLARVRTDPALFVHYTEPHDYRTTYDRLSQLQQITLADVIEDYDWIGAEEYEQLDWAEGLRQIMGLAPPAGDDVTGILYTLNANKLLQFRLTPQDIAEKLQFRPTAQDITKLVQERRLVWLPSPATRHQLAVFVNREEWFKHEETKDVRASEYPEEGIDVSALTKLVQEKERKYQLSGMKGVSGFRVRSWPILDRDVVRSVTLMAGDKEKEKTQEGKKTQEQTWLIVLNPLTFSLRNVPLSEVVRLLESLDYKVTVIGPEELQAVGVGNPLDLVTKQMAAAVAAEDTAVQKRLAELKADAESGPEVRGDFDFRPVAAGTLVEELAAPYRYYFGETRGSNLRELALRPGIDRERSTSNVYQELLEVFGIEVVRAFLVREGTAVLKSIGESLTPSNLILLVDYMTRSGVLTPTNYHSISKSKAGPLVKGSASKAFDHWLAGGLFGEEEKITAPSAAMYTATLMGHGTGSIDLLPAPREERKVETKKEERKEVVQEKTESKVVVRLAMERAGPARLPDPDATLARLPQGQRPPAIKGLL